jgi:hypothetical protein
MNYLQEEITQTSKTEIGQTAFLILRAYRKLSDFDRIIINKFKTNEAILSNF